MRLFFLFLQLLYQSDFVNIFYIVFRRKKKPSKENNKKAMSLLSWEEYDKQFHLSEVLTHAARACVSSRTLLP